jgi:ribosome-associated toxin RatA of RatAB toxin-antitoxin module
MSQFGGEGTVEVEAGRDRCFEVAADAERYPEWHPVIKSLGVLDRDSEGRAAKARLVVDASVSTVTVEVAFSYEPPGVVECRRQSGDLKEMRTRFELSELGPDRTRLDYSTGLDPGRRLSMMARGPVLEKVRHKLVEDAMAGFKRAAESG